MTKDYNFAILYFVAPLIFGLFPLLIRKSNVFLRRMALIYAVAAGGALICILSFALYTCPPYSCTGPDNDVYLLPYAFWPILAPAVLALPSLLIAKVLQR